MSEKLSQSSSPESELEKKYNVKKPEHHQPSSERLAKHEHEENIANLRKTAELVAKPTQETVLKTKSSENETGIYPATVNKDLKNMAYRRTLRRTQQQLSAPSRTLSKIIHQPAIEASSEVIGKTIARPSGILSGGIVAFFGSSVFLWITRHYGYEYSFLLMLLLFVGGFCLGLMLEFFIRFARKRP
jgi:hypothetical protein